VLVVVEMGASFPTSISNAIITTTITFRIVSLQNWESFTNSLRKQQKLFQGHEGNGLFLYFGAFFSFVSCSVAIFCCCCMFIYLHHYHRLHHLLHLMLLHYFIIMMITIIFFIINIFIIFISSSCAPTSSAPKLSF
jgi:hypothetical protein